MKSGASPKRVLEQVNARAWFVRREKLIFRNSASAGCGKNAWVYFMDSNLLSALIGLIGGLLGVAIGAYLQQRVTDAQLNRQTTLQLYERLDDSDIRESRIRADALL